MVAALVLEISVFGRASSNLATRTKKNKIEEDYKIRVLDDELEKLGFNQEQTLKILEWVNTIPVRIYNGENIKVEIKKGVVRINEDVIDPKDLSFNELPKELRLSYLYDNNFFYNPFKIPPGTILFNPFSGEYSTIEGTKPDIGNTIKFMYNPVNSKVIGKLEFKDSKPFKRWVVSDDNKWIESEFK